ncbi:MAG TPA: TonB-dependent receptor [Candidatus Acidoferrales bacterium]|nr:TonB-dependent receptor [Candidatus Acidoferrales bacterium]
MRKWFCGICGLLLCLALTSNVWGQAQITTGTVEGDVLDEKGGTVPGATVEIKNIDTNFSRTQTTGGDGHFAFLLLPPGRYTLTISKPGFATTVQENVSLTVGQAVSLSVRMKVSAVAERIVVTATPTVEVTKTESSSTLNQITVSETPILGRKFEDLLTLTPGVSIVQGPDGDEVNFNGQRGVYNNVSLDGGDYNNRFFGEQLGGQRAAIDITLEAVKEFQVVASGASAEFGRTAGGVINVITKSGTNQVHGSAFHFQRLEALSSATSDGKPLQDFRREQFGGSLGGPLVKDKMFFFGAGEGIVENLTRPNLSAPLGPACSVATPVVGVNDGVIATSTECQRVALLNFFRTRFNQDEGQPVKRPVRNAAFMGKYDWNVKPEHALAVSYSFDYSKNTNQTFDVPTYGNSANGIEGPSKIQVVNANFNSILSATKLNEAHFTYARESRPRDAAPGTVPDTDMGFGTTFRFGMPFFLQPNVNELLYHTEIRDNFSIISGKHTIKFGGEWLHTRNTQIFRGFFKGRYIFSDVTGFLHYASPQTPFVAGFGPTAAECPGNVFVDRAQTCPGGGAPAGILLLYLQQGATSGPTTDATGASSIKNEDSALFIQDKWQIWPGFTFNYGLRWEAVIFPDPVTPPSKTAYGINLSNPAFDSDGTIHNQKKQFQPRVGFAWDIANNHKSALRASWGIYNASQNMLAQVGAITTNGVQQQAIAAGTFFNSAGGPPPTYPGVVVAPMIPPGTFPPGSGVTVFSKSYANPRIYTTNVAFEQEIYPNLAAYADFTWGKGVHLTRQVNPNVSPNPAANCGASATLVPPGVCIPLNGDSATYPGPAPFPNLGAIDDTASSAKSLYRGLTIGARKRFSQRFQMEANYTYSKDLDDDSSERDPFTFRYANLFNLAAEYANSDRDERHKFNFFTYAELPWGFQADVRTQAHSAQPITDNFTLVPTGPACSPTNSNTRFVNGIDCGRNHLRKDNQFFSFDWRLMRPFKFGERFALIPLIEMFNTFNNKNNVNPLISPGPFNFDGFLRQGVGDPRQAQFAVRFTF